MENWVEGWLDDDGGKRKDCRAAIVGLADFIDNAVGLCRRSRRGAAIGEAIVSRMAFEPGQWIN